MYVLEKENLTTERIHFKIFSVVLIEDFDHYATYVRTSYNYNARM